MYKFAQDSGMIFFVHIQKTGGTSLKAMLSPFFPKDAIYPNAWDQQLRAKEHPGVPHSYMIPYIDVNFVRRLPVERRNQIRFFCGHLPACVGELFEGPVRYISFFRSPVSRTLSHLKHVRTLTRRYKHMSLDDVYTEEVKNFRLRDLQTRHFAHELTETLAAVIDPLEITATHLERAKQRVSQLDFFGLQEDFETSIRMFSRQFGIPIPQIAKERFNSEECTIPVGLPKRIEKDNYYDMQLYEFARKLYYERCGQIARSA